MDRGAEAAEGLTRGLACGLARSLIFAVFLAFTFKRMDLARRAGRLAAFFTVFRLGFAFVAMRLCNL